jgi:predicted transposase/invertase (TIGR01784 family)
MIFENHDPEGQMTGNKKGRQSGCRQGSPKGHTPLQHKMTNDILAKMMFVQHPDLLLGLASALLDIPAASITGFAVVNPEIPPDSLGEKFCRLDINMAVNGQRLDLEIQVADEGDYPERSLYYWARDFSSALASGCGYKELPRTVVVSIVAFDLFPDYDGFHSEFEALEVRRGVRLTDKLNLQYFELPKVPAKIDAGDRMRLWLTLFAAESEEDLSELERLEVPEMTQAISAYRSTVVRPEFKELERLRELARHNEASALDHARRQEREKWEGVVADKDAAIADKDAALADKDVVIADKEAALAEQAARIAELENALAQKQN